MPTRWTCMVATTLLLLASLAGCRSGTPPAPATVSIAPQPPAPRSTALAAAAPATPPGEPCEPFLAKARSDLVTKIPRRDDFSPDTFEHGICSSSANGVWAIEYVDVDVTTSPSTSPLQPDPVTLHASRQLVHVSRRGARTVGAKTPFTITGYAANWASLSEPFDFDGDGNDEVVLYVGFSSPGQHALAGRVMTSLGGRIAAYVPAERVDVRKLEDVDEDGRPDLLTVGPYQPEAEVICGSLDGDDSQVHLLAAHSLPGGGFSMTDGAAVVFARKACPAPIKKIAMDTYSTGPMAELRCARLWGMSAADATKNVLSTCRKQSTKNCPGTNGECLHFDTMIAWSKAEPPLRLAP